MIIASFSGDEDDEEENPKGNVLRFVMISPASLLSGYCRSLVYSIAFRFWPEMIIVVVVFIVDVVVLCCEVR